MDENQTELQEPQQTYSPRPRWQVWLARVAVAIMIVCVALYYWHIASGGLG